MAKKTYTLVDIFKNYERDHLSTHKHHLEKNLFLDIAKTFFKGLSKLIIEEGYEYELPSRMGRVYIKKFKPSNPKKNIDFNLTRELYGEWNKNNPNDKKKVYHKNLHSSGWSSRWYWNKKSCVVTNKSFYRFKAVRSNTRATSSAIKYKNTIENYAS